MIANRETRMGIRKPIFRMIACAVVLSLVAVAAVPAKTVCRKACSCCKESKSQLQDSATILTLPPMVQRSSVFLAVFHPDHIYAPFLKSYSLYSSCHEMIVNTPCDMKKKRTVEAPQSSIPTFPRTDHSPLGAIAFLSADISFNNLPFFRLAAKHLLTVRAGPIQL